MKRELSLVLVLGCCGILFLEAPDALSSLDAALRGPYPSPVEAQPDSLRASTALAPLAGEPGDEGSASSVLHPPAAEN